MLSICPDLSCHWQLRWLPSSLLAITVIFVPYGGLALNAISDQSLLIQVVACPIMCFTQFVSLLLQDEL